MKRSKTFMGLMFLCSALSLWGLDKAAGKPAYGDFIDSDHQFKLKYPLDLLPSPGSPITFISKDHMVFLKAWAEPHLENRTWKMEYENQLNLYSGGRVTRRVFDKNFLAFSGVWEGWGFFWKEVPFEVKVKRWVLKFQMMYRPRAHPEMRAAAALCANSLRFTRHAGKYGLIPGWRETAVDARRDRLVRLARKWVAKNLRCAGLAQVQTAPKGKSRASAKWVLDEGGIQLFHWTSPVAFQFVMPVHAPAQGGTAYVLFTGLHSEIKGDILLQTRAVAFFGGPGNGVEIMKRPRGPDLLLLDTGDGACGVTEHVFMPVHGKVWEVLSCKVLEDDCPPGLGPEGFEGFLIPDGNRQLRLLKHHWDRNPLEVSDPKDPNSGKTFGYSEVQFRFDPVMKIFSQVGAEKELPYKKPGRH